jgi:hypothetical protein
VRTNESKMKLRTNIARQMKRQAGARPAAQTATST